MSNDNPTVDAVAFVRDALSTLPTEPERADVDELRATILAVNSGLEHRVKQLLGQMGEIGKQVLEHPTETAANAERLRDAEWVRVLIARCRQANESLILYAARAAEAHGTTVGALVGGD